MASSPILSPRRTSNEIVLYLSPTQPAPLLPFELHGSIAPDVWATRLPIIARTAGKYSKPLFERVWLVIAFLAVLIVPMALHDVIYQAILRDDNKVDARMKARGFSGLIFFGLILLFFVPILAWKLFGRMQMKRVLRRWAAADHKNGLSSSSVSDWSVKTPGVFKDSTVLTIKLPANLSPSSFHPDAYLPSYINGALDADANYYYPYKHNEPGLPRMSVVGNVPLYSDEKRGFHELDFKV
jgi:hypothetical protein